MTTAAVDLHWIPLGAGGHVVRFNGRVYEAITAAREHRPRLDLYHSALTVLVPGEFFTIEMTPIPDLRGSERGVVAEGPVGTRWAGRLRLFRYEVRRWRNGTIPDIAYALAGPVRVSEDPIAAQQLLDLLPSIPTPTWGRDELRAGEMWNCNSVISWALTAAGLDAGSIVPPPGGRAPGWDAGIAVARRGLADRAAMRAQKPFGHKAFLVEIVRLFG